jgi:hypothetical protein
MPQRFVYHAVPPAMVGETLYPLRDLFRLEPDLYRLERAKYDDHPERRRIPQCHIAKLNCVGEEVLNFSPVHPNLIYRAWQGLGVTLKPKLWFGIPLERLLHLPVVVTVPENKGRVGEDLGNEAVRWLEPETYRELTALPEVTLRWYMRLVQEKKRGGWFVGVPHVLVKGQVSAIDLDPFDWSVDASL